MHRLLVKMLEMNLYTIGLPVALLASTLFYYIYSKYLMQPFLALVMDEVHSRINLKKQHLFNEALSFLTTSRPVDILEIGVGGGQNFRHFPRNANVHILDKTGEFSKDLASKRKQYCRWLVFVCNYAKVIFSRVVCREARPEGG